MATGRIDVQLRVDTTQLRMAARAFASWARAVERAHHVFSDRLRRAADGMSAVERLWRAMGAPEVRLLERRMARAAARSRRNMPPVDDLARWRGGAWRVCGGCGGAGEHFYFTGLPGEYDCEECPACEGEGRNARRGRVASAHRRRNRHGRKGVRRCRGTR